MRTAGTMRITLASMLVLSGTAAGADPVLQWKLKPGQVLRQANQSDVTTTTTVGASPQKVTQSMRFDTLLTVKSVSANGTADLTQKCERLVLKMNLASGQSFEYDSQAPRELKGPIWTSIGPLLKALSTSEASMQMTASGKIESFKLSDALLKLIRSSPGAGAMGDFFSVESLQRMSSQWPALEEGALPVGKTWTTRATNELPVGKMTTVSTYTYQGIEKQAGRDLHKFALKTALGIEKKDPNQLEIHLKPTDSSGTLFFDAEAGRFVEMVHKQTMTLEIGGEGAGFESVTESTFRSRCEEAPPQLK